jgi:hypothetical protein
MNNEWNVQNFLNQLKNAQPQPRTNEPKSPTLEKTYLNLPDNLGRYQIFPMISTVTGMPFEYLYKTKEVNIVTGTNQDGTQRRSWHKLLPLSAYSFIDNTNRLVSSLTQSERDLLESAYGVFDRMWEVVPETQRKDLCRVKNYTIGNAFVINKYGLRDNTKPLRSNFSTLLVCTSKDFANAINKDIEMQMINHGNDPMWLGEIYNRKTEGRTGWLIFNITNAANGIGFSVSASHTSNLPATATDGLKIPAEDVSLMDDPIRTFLGWQAGKEKLFNEQLITSVIEEMNRVISKYSNSAVYANPAQAIQATQSTAQSAVPPVAPTNDPMVAALNNTAAPQQKMVQTPEQMVQNNNDPFVNPPASQFDPMAGVPNNYGQFQGQPQPQFQNGVNPQFGGANVGYTQPAFAQNAAGAQQPTSVPNPFETGSN